jgi:hypothetical protein
MEGIPRESADEQPGAQSTEQLEGEHPSVASEALDPFVLSRSELATSAPRVTTGL